MTHAKKGTTVFQAHYFFLLFILCAISNVFDDAC